MKNLILLLTMLITTCCFASNQISLNGQWQFSYTPSSAEKVPEIPSLERFDTQYEIPDFWDNQMETMKSSCWFKTATFREDIPYLYGIGWVRKVIEIPDDWRDKVISLQINRAVGYLNLWVNRQQAGSYRYAFYTPCQFDITDLLSYGTTNELLISVDNTRIAPFGEAWCFFWPNYFASGVTDDITLRVSSGSGRVSDVYVRAGKTLKDVVVDVELDNKTGWPLEQSVLEWQILDSEQKIVAAGKQNTGEIDINKSVSFTEIVDGILPWSVDNPKLYSLEIKWLCKDSLLDSTTQRFGIRKLEGRGRKLFLNDKPIYLRGQFGAYYFPTQGGVVCSKEYWLDNLRKSKQLGMNYLNFAAQVAPVGLLEAADEVGIILQCGDHITVLENNREYYAEVWNPIVKFTRKYPSLCIYGFGGERNYYEGILEQYKTQYELIKSLNPSCMVMPQQAIRGIDYAFDTKGREELTLTPFPHHKNRLEFYTQYCDFFGHYSCEGLSYCHDEMPLWQDMDKRFEIYSKPLSAHELFIASSYIDPENIVKYSRRFPPLLYNRTQEMLKERSLLEKWPTYAHNSEMLQGIFVKYNLEKVRKCNNMVAFEFLGMSDMHIFYPKAFATGILDEFYEFKDGICQSDLLKCNSDTVLLLDYDGGSSVNRAYWSGGEFSADVIVSHYGQEDINNAMFEWKLTSGDKTYISGSNHISVVQTGYAKKMTDLNFIWPRVDKTTHFKLEFRLLSNGRTILNDWDFWVFAPVSYCEVYAGIEEGVSKALSSRYKNVVAYGEKPRHNLLITSKLSEYEISHLENGGDVLLLGYEPFEIHDKYTNFRPGLGARSHHNVGRVLYDHPIFNNLMNDGWGNWQFYYIFNGAVSVLFDDIVRDSGIKFDPIAEVISSPDQPRRQACIFEMRVGRGRLFVSTAVYDSENPACVTLLDSILRYVQGDEFSPSVVFSSGSLRKMAGITNDSEKISGCSKALEVEVPPIGTAEIWHNQTMAFDFGDQARCKVNDGRWAVVSNIKVASEGRNKLYVEKNGSSKVLDVNIDITVPSLELSCEPSIEQIGGVYIAKPGTVLTLNAFDSLSGIASLKYSFDDGETFLPYVNPLTLSKGDYLLRCHAVDNAGNSVDVIGGHDLTGGRTTQVFLRVK